MTPGHIAAAIACSFFFIGDLAAQGAAGTGNGAPAASATRRTGDVRIDGRIDETAWASAVPATNFVQSEPVEGDSAQFRTEVRTLFDDDALYVAARMYDSDPGSIARQLVRRDEFGQADWFAVGFDPRLDRRTAYVFFVSAANVQSDRYVFNDEEADGAWDAVWESAVRIDSLGWTAELRIPLSQLRYDAGNGPQSWGVNFARRRLRNNEETHFALMSRLRRGRVSQFATMTGIELNDAPRRAEIRPYVLGSVRSEPVQQGNPFRDGSDVTGRTGLDLRYGLGPSFTLDATINPDFGQVEADPAVINLTAFETFFEERRPFFVQDAQIFNFQLSGQTNRLFYGRRVGRSPAGRAPAGASFSEIADAASILGAAKFTGRTPRGLSVGAIAALTGKEYGRAWFSSTSEMRRFLAEPQATHGALRLKQDMNDGASTIGVITTVQRRDLPGDGSFDFLPRTAVSAGVDWEHQWNDRRYSFQGYVAGSHIAGDSTAMIRVQRASNHWFQRPDALRLRVDSSATDMSGIDWRMTLEKRGGRYWTGAVWAAQVTPGFEVNDLGFSGRQEVIDAGTRVSYREITPGRVFRSYGVSLFTFHNWSHEALESPWSSRSWGRSHVQGMFLLNKRATLRNYWELESRISYRPEMLDRNATRGGPLMLQPRAMEWSFEVESDPRRAVSVEAGGEFEYGTMGAGRREAIALGLSVRPSSRVEAVVSPVWEQGTIGAQHVATSRAVPHAPTFGSRYLFAELARRELSLETRVNVTFSPTLTLQAFLQPLLSSGDYLTYKQLLAPRTFAFESFPEGTYVTGSPARCAGGRTCLDPAGARLVDLDGNGSVDDTFRDRDFNVRSLIANMVMRWEYRPGSTLFVVWQRRQEDEERIGGFNFSRDARALVGAPARNVFMIKASYWLGF